MIIGGSTWPEVTLGDVCEFKYGRALKSEDRQPGNFGVFGSNGKVGTHTAAITNGPTIIVGRKGSYGEVTLSPDACWPIDTTYYVDATCTKADLRWLSYRLAGLGLTELNRAAAVPGLNREDAYRLRLRLPPINEQRLIADVLRRADALNAKRHDSLTHLDDLVGSMFLDMFGVPDSDWTECTVASLAADDKGSIRTGPFGSQLLHSEFVDQGITVLGIDNAVSNEFAWGRPRFITEQKFRELSRYRVHPGDVLITIMGTVGRCAVVPNDIPLCINTKHLCCITLDKNRCLPDFLHGYFLRHPTAKNYLRRTAKGAIMAGLNMDIIRKLPIVLPPLDLQSAFVGRLAAVRAARHAHQRAADESKVLFESLRARAFQGEL